MNASFKKFSGRFTATLTGAILVAGIACTRQPVIPDFPITPVPVTDVTLADGFWAPRIERNHQVTIPAVINKLYETGRIRNFEHAANVLHQHSDGEEFCTAFPFDDSDVFKLIEAGSYALMIKPDPVLESRLDSLIMLIGQAQEHDGYLYTARSMNPDKLPEMSGEERWEKEQENSHELYNLGHLYEAACTHYLATGKKNLLKIATKSADFLYDTFIKGGLVRYPGHQEIETGLARLYRTTGNPHYLELARFYLDVRGPGGQEYNQAHLKPVDQTTAVGHAVRSVYQYRGMAETGVLTGDQSFIEPLGKIWNDIISSKTYVTGGIGSKQENEGYGEPYDLPNHSAYSETCSSIGFILWNHRMFLLTGDSKYIDVMERTLFNAFLSGISLSGDHYFYPNPLESRGKKSRPDWYACACCPPNIARFIPMVPELFYATGENRVFVNLFATGTAHINLAGNEIQIVQESNYPWDGEITMTISPKRKGSFDLMLRLPGWSRDEAFPSDLYRFATPDAGLPSLAINGTPVEPEMEKGYARISRSWEKGDQLTISIPMPVRLVTAHPAIEANIGKVAVQRGPIIFTAEAADNQGSVLTRVIDRDGSLTGQPTGLHVEYRTDLLTGVQVINGLVRQYTGPTQFQESELILIPYFAWANREPGEMAVWLPTNPEYIARFPVPPGLEAKAIASASYAYDNSIPYLNDGLEPSNSADRSSNAFRLHPKKGTTEWVIYDFPKQETVSSVSVYWLQDGSYGLPVAWRLSYRDSDGNWQPVKNTTPYIIIPDEYNKLKFNAVKTTGLKLEMTLSDQLPGGIIEWRVE